MVLYCVTRSEASENYDHVRDVLTGRRDDTVLGVGRDPGELCIFKGCHSLHRVSGYRLGLGQRNI